MPKLTDIPVLIPRAQEGTLVRIRPFEDRDALEIAKIFRDDPDLLLAMNSSYFPTFSELEHESASILKAYKIHQRKWDQIGFTIADKTNDALIGYISIGLSDDEKREARIGPWLSSAFWGQGHFFESAQLLFEWSKKSNIKSLTWRVQVDNFRAQKGAEKLGFELTRKDPPHLWYKKVIGEE